MRQIAAAEATPPPVRPPPGEEPAMLIPEELMSPMPPGLGHDGSNDTARVELRGVPAAEALDAWLAACDQPRLEAGRVPIAAALGRVTSAPVQALRSSPGFPAAAMDGIAVSAADTLGACPDRPVRLAAGRFDVVDTGDPLPAGRDAIVVREQVARDDDVATLTATAS